MEMVVEHHHLPHHHQLQQHRHQQEPPVIDTDKLSYEIFSILESKFLFGYDDDGGVGGGGDGQGQNPPGNDLQQHQQWVSKPMGPPDDPPALSASFATLPPPSASIKNQRGKVCILSIDGGSGLRGGILAGKALAYLEQALRSKSGDEDARISDYFDVAAGTGMGGIFTAMLFACGGDGGGGSTGAAARPLYHADDTWRFVSDSGTRLFVSGKRRKRRARSPMSKRGFLGCFMGGGGTGTVEGSGEEEVGAATKGMEQSLKEAFGEQLTLRDTLKPVLIPCYDLLSSAPFLFSRADALEAESFDFRLWEVCRATSAEPGRFEPVEMMSVDGTTRCVAVDGGLAMSNPTAAAITHVLHNKQEFPFVRGVEDLMVLSLGTGGSSGGASSSVPTDYEQLRRWRAKEWARPIARIASDGTADLVDHAVAMAFNNSRSGGNYVRIQAAQPGAASAGVFAGPNSDNDPSPQNVEQFIWLAESMLKQKNVESVLFGGRRIGEHTNSEKLEWFAGELVLEHQRRSCRIAPTVAFKQAQSASKPA